MIYIWPFAFECHTYHWCLRHVSLDTNGTRRGVAPVFGGSRTIVTTSVTQHLVNNTIQSVSHLFSFRLKGCKPINGKEPLKRLDMLYSPVGEWDQVAAPSKILDYSHQCYNMVAVFCMKANLFGDTPFQLPSWSLKWTMHVKSKSANRKSIRIMLSSFLR